MKFRKKPVVIEAKQWRPTEYPAWANLASWLEVGGCAYELSDPVTTLVIVTLEGRMIAQPGDWIIQGVKGEFYPCKPDIFEATYEAVES